jgi:uncharacterized protein
MSKVRCPVCGRPFDSDQSATMPFCGERCRIVDLDRWLSEGYGLPCSPEEEPEPPEETDHPEPES